MKRHLIPWIGVATALPVFACPRCLDLPPALETHARQADVFHFLPDGSTRFGGPVGDLMRVTAGEWFDAKTLAEMADVFRRRPNGFATGEFWGKATRARSRHIGASGKEARVLGANGIPPWKRVALTDREDFKGGLGF